jgi:multidrug efflux pump subunit AcrB
MQKNGRAGGQTAAQKSNELLWHMVLAIVSVSALIWLALGRRESAVVLTAIPVTLALTLFVFYLYGYTLNRITLFALIFSIGILVDDAIVVVENIVRHARMSRDGPGLEATAVRAVDEVGNPTILATLAVIAAILPMAFVGGLMGPYMRPIPVGASAAMVFSLIVAFVVTPWAAVRLLRRSPGHHDEPEDRLTALYRRVMHQLIVHRSTRIAFLGLVAEGYSLEIFNTHQPFDNSKYAMKWDGEWHITYEEFRDLGIAFAAVLVLIYILVVGWFQSFVTPITIMLAIPFSLVGILPAHAALGAFFTATSMIGFIAGAGIVVRNSIILVDFIELRVRDGMPLEEAVVDAGAVRFRPMALTAAAVIAGSAVILFDPIFQGLAISLMAGEVASLLLSRMTVPITYYLTHRHRPVAAADPVVAA